MKYKFEIRFENQNGGQSSEFFSCDAGTEKAAKDQLRLYLLHSDKIGAEIKLVKKSYANRRFKDTA